MFFWWSNFCATSGTKWNCKCIMDKFCFCALKGDVIHDFVQLGKFTYSGHFEDFLFLQDHLMSVKPEVYF